MRIGCKLTTGTLSLEIQRTVLAREGRKRSELQDQGTPPDLQFHWMTILSNMKTQRNSELEGFSRLFVWFLFWGHCFRTVLDLQQNWAEVQNFYILYVSTHELPTPLSTSAIRVELMNLSCVCFTILEGTSQRTKVSSLMSMARYHQKLGLLCLGSNPALVLILYLSQLNHNAFRETYMAKYRFSGIPSKKCLISTWFVKVTIAKHQNDLTSGHRKNFTFIWDILEHYQQQCLFSGLHMLLTMTHNLTILCNY